jgi:hypothetical protein
MINGYLALITASANDPALKYEVGGDLSSVRRLAKKVETRGSGREIAAVK